MTAWPDGPREWSPRLAEALREIDKLRPLIPASLIVEQDRHWHTGTVIPCRMKGEPEVLSKLALLVKVPPPIDLGKSTPPWEGAYEDLAIVWLYEDGFVYVDLQIYYLLTGQIKGWENLAGSWPWKDFRGPPDPTGRGVWGH